jgi:metal-dependent hydrolase (beta-lactamase superfamily II)
MSLSVIAVRLPLGVGLERGPLLSVAELKKFDIEHVMPMHCSGQNFIDLAKREMPERLVLCGTGSTFTFTA